MEKSAGTGKRSRKPKRIYACSVICFQVWVSSAQAWLTKPYLKYMTRKHTISPLNTCRNNSLYPFGPEARTNREVWKDNATQRNAASMNSPLAENIPSTAPHSLQLTHTEQPHILLSLCHSSSKSQNKDEKGERWQRTARHQHDGVNICVHLPLLMLLLTDSHFLKVKHQHETHRRRCVCGQLSYFVMEMGSLRTELIPTRALPTQPAIFNSGKWFIMRVYLFNDCISVILLRQRSVCRQGQKAWHCSVDRAFQPKRSQFVEEENITTQKDALVAGLGFCRKASLSAAQPSPPQHRA